MSIDYAQLQIGLIQISGCTNSMPADGGATRIGLEPYNWGQCLRLDLSYPVPRMRHAPFQNLSIQEGLTIASHNVVGSGTEMLHGAQAKCAGDRCPTIFPVLATTGATFNRSAWHAVGSAVGDEMRAINNNGTIGRTDCSLSGPGVSGWGQFSLSTVVVFEAVVLTFKGAHADLCQVPTSIL